jgi:hypothetical protein
MIFKMSDDGEWYWHMDDMDAMVALVAHLHVALFLMQHGLDDTGLSRPMQDILDQATFILANAKLIKGISE